MGLDYLYAVAVFLGATFDLRTALTALVVRRQEHTAPKSRTKSADFTGNSR
jgi:hypothetical protein